MGQIPEVKFKATLQPHLVWSADQVLYLSTENVASTPLLELHLLPTRVEVPMAIIMLENRALWIDLIWSQLSPGEEQPSREEISVG